MALTINGVAVANVTRNGNLLDKATVNGTAVWTYASPVGSEWVTKTGFYNKMTSATSPAYNITSNETLYFLEPWQLFDGNWNNRATINISVNHTRYIQQDLLSAKIIPTKIKVEKTYNDSNAASGTLTVQVSADGSSWTNFGSTSTTKNWQQSQTFVTLSNNTLSSPIRYIRASYNNHGDHTQYGFNEIQIVEWKEKIEWTNKTGTLASSSVSGEFNPWSLTDDVCKTQTINLSSPTKVTSVYLYCGTRRVDNGGWCNGRVTLTGKTASGSTVTLLNKYTDFDRNGKTVTINNTSELVSVTWTWYTPDSTWRDYNVNQNGYVNAWQVQE